MPGLVGVDFTMFFDRSKVVAAMERKERRVLSATGAFSRTVMKRGMRKRKAVSKPGAYPNAHAGHLRRLIFFGHDGDSVVVGPLLFKPRVDGRTIPDIVNTGGRVRVKRRNRKTGRVVKRKDGYRPRPFVNLTAPIAARQLAANMEKFDF